MVAATADRIDLKKVFTSDFLSPWKAASFVRTSLAGGRFERLAQFPLSQVQRRLTHGLTI